MSSSKMDKQQNNRLQVLHPGVTLLAGEEYLSTEPTGAFSEEVIDFLEIGRAHV